MNKTILVVTGSPRQGGNSDKLADAFIEGALQAGNKVLRFDAGRCKISGCIGCETCFSTGHPCSFVDDFEGYANYLQQADSVVFFTPLYWAGLPTQLKAAIDKMYCFYCSGTPVSVKESFFVICGHSTDLSLYDAAVLNYQKIAEIMKWENKGHIVVPGVYQPGEVANTPALEGMKKIGAAL